jgi:DNA-binding MarR family transcriptional regulator
VGYARRVRAEKDRRQVIVELTPLLMERAGKVWAPLGNDAVAEFGRMSVEELKIVIDFFKRGRDMNQRHLERVRDLSLE